MSYLFHPVPNVYCVGIDYNIMLLGNAMYCPFVSIDGIAMNHEGKPDSELATSRHILPGNGCLHQKLKSNAIQSKFSVKER